MAEEFYFPFVKIPMRNMFDNIKRNIFLSLSMSSLMALSACGGDGKDVLNEIGDRIGVTDPAVRFVNAVPRASLTLYRNGSNSGLDLNGIGYASITKLKSFKDDMSTFSIRSSNNVETGVAGSFNAAKGHRYLAVAFPSSVNGGQSGLPTLKVLDDPYKRQASVVPAIRMVNATDSNMPFDVYVTRPDQDLGNPTVPNLPFMSFWPMSGNDSLKLDNVDGKYRIRLTVAGNPGSVLLDSGPLSLDANADAVVVILPKTVDTISSSTVARGDLRLLIDNANQDNRSTQEIFDKP